MCQIGWSRKALFTKPHSLSEVALAFAGAGRTTKGPSCSSVAMRPHIRINRQEPIRSILRTEISKPPVRLKHLSTMHRRCLAVPKPVKQQHTTCPDPCRAEYMRHIWHRSVAQNTVLSMLDVAPSSTLSPPLPVDSAPPAGRPIASTRPRHPVALARFTPPSDSPTPRAKAARLGVADDCR